MTFEQEVEAADAVIQRDYLTVVVSAYTPLFDRITKKAAAHMDAKDIGEIDLGIHSGLIFRPNERFYNKEGKPVDLRQLPELFQEESNYIAGCGDDRSHRTPSVHEAMRSALSIFREKVKQSYFRYS